MDTEFDPEARITNIVRRIDQSDLLDSDKIHLFAEIADGLKAAVLPVLLTHVSREELTAMSRNPASVTLDRYIEFIAHAFDEGVATDDVVRSLGAVIIEIERALEESGIPMS